MRDCVHITTDKMERGEISQMREILANILVLIGVASV
jgi:hypothetical protein